RRAATAAGPGPPRSGSPPRAALTTGAIRSRRYRSSSRCAASTRATTTTASRSGRSRVTGPLPTAIALSALLLQSPHFGIGRAPTAEELKAIDIEITPDGRGLPPGG